jgi:hypothetical protein
VKQVDIYIGYTKDVVIEESRDCENLTIGIIELNGSFHGARTDIKIPARSYEMLEQAVVERWLEKKKSL